MCLKKDMPNSNRSIFLDRKLLIFISLTFLFSFVHAASLPNLQPEKSTAVAVNLNSSTNNVNRSDYWGNYFFSDYDMPTILKFAINQTLDALRVTNLNPNNFINISGVDNTNIAYLNQSIPFIVNQTINTSSIKALSVIASNSSVNTLMVDTINNRIGVNTIPTAKIDVKSKDDDSDLLFRLINNNYTGTTIFSGGFVNIEMNTPPTTGGVSANGVTFNITNKHKMMGTSFSATQNIVGITNIVFADASTENNISTTIAHQDNYYGMQNSVKPGPRLVRAKRETNNNFGVQTAIATGSIRYNGSESASTSYNINNYGTQASINSVGVSLQRLSDTITVNNYGESLTLIGQLNSNVTTTNVGIHLFQIRDANVNYGIKVEETSAEFKNLLGLNSQKTYFGTSEQSSINYNGTNFEFSPREVGKGAFAVKGDVIIQNNFTANQLIGGMWFDNDSTTGQAVTIGAGVWNNISFTTTSDKGQDLNGFTFVNGNALNCSDDGFYDASYSVSLETTGVNKEYNIAITNGTDYLHNTESHFKLGVTGDVSTIADGGFVRCSKGKYIFLQIRQVTGNDDVGIHQAKLKMVRVMN